MKRILIIVMTLSFLACGGKKEAVAPDLTDALINTYWLNQVSFDHLSLKGKIEIESPSMSQSASVNIRMKKDSVIWMSVSLIGFEGLRILITQDSFKMLNRVDNSYMARSLDYFNQIIGFDAELSEIQNIMIGNAPFDQFSYQLVQGDTLSWLKAQKADIINKLLINGQSRTMNSSFSSLFRAENADVSYSSYEQMESIHIPTVVEGKMFDGVNHSGATLTYSSASTAKINSYPFRVPENATKL